MIQVTIVIRPRSVEFREERVEGSRKAPYSHPDVEFFTKGNMKDCEVTREAVTAGVQGYLAYHKLRPAALVFGEDDIDIPEWAQEWARKVGLL